MSATFRPGGTNFSFRAMVPPTGSGPTVKFRALLDSLSDDSSPNWSENNDIGRADPKMLYSSYSRTISLSFKTAALNPGEEDLWMEAINTLAEMTKPVYKRGLGYNGVFCHMKLGQILDVYGILSSVSYSIDNETPWIKDVPVVIQVSVSFKVLDNKKPDYRNGNRVFNYKGFGQGTGS